MLKTRENIFKRLNMTVRTRGKKASTILWNFLLVSIFQLWVMTSTVLAGTYKADVIIVGAGGAGLAAAYEAASRGASVIVAELDSTYGGTAAMSGGGCFAVGTPLQKEKGFEDSPDLAFQDWIRWGLGEADEQWARYYIEHSLHDLYEWLEGLGVVWEAVSFNEGNTVPRWHRPIGFGRLLSMKLYEGARGQGVKKWLFDTRIEKILEKEGRVIGVSGNNQKTGEKIELYGKAVVMATGGFAGSRESVQRYAPWLSKYRYYVAGNRNCIGLGHRMIKQSGGYLTHMDNLWIYVYATPDYEDPAEERALVLRFMPRSNGIWVNALGRRFHNEDLSGGASGTPAVLAQDPPFAWSVHDALAEGTMFVMDPSYTADFSRMHEKKLKLLHNSPFIMKSDSLRELAQKMSVKPDTLVETVRKYNEFIEKGADLEFGRNVKGLRKIETPPFYAIQFFPAVRKTMGGVKTNLKCQVLNKHFAPIPGLYAAGELAGMAGGHIQGKASLEGTMLGPSIFSGRVAGAWAAHEAGKGKGFSGRALLVK
jgi:flavocytochrome c